MKEDFLQRYDILLLASLIRLFLMELPECLLTFELYEPFKLLYTNSQDDESRLVSISKLLATLPATNFYTIKTLVNHFHKLFEDSGDVHSSELLENIASIFGHIIIRSQIESNLKIHDKHPQRLMRDLIKHYHSVFSVETHKAQGEHASRRSIVANFETASKEPSLKSPSFSSTSSAISTLASDTGLTATSATSATSQEVSNKDVKPSVSVPARRRTLLSFMRRGTLEQSQNSGVLGKGGLKTSTSTPRKPIHVPSASMLFEDPEETSNDHVSPTHTFFNPDTGKEEHTFLCQHISQSRQISTSNIDLAKNSHTTLSNHTRHDSIESTNNIDQGSMSSFFDDEDF
ncbi:Rho GTPase activation protein [Spinellus fusiger]|nr:Rho GTPase activation protein [Spinellus fusiger]